VPAGFDTVSHPPAKQGRREVFLSFVGGHKVRNPAAAMALINASDSRGMSLQRPHRPMTGDR